MGTQRSTAFLLVCDGV